MSEIGPVYGVELRFTTLPIGGSMKQQLPSAADLAQVRKRCERTAAGYEVLMAHYCQTLDRLDAAERERDEARKDKERMDWLEEKEAAEVNDFRGVGIISDDDGVGIRAAIDAARKEAGDAD